MTEVTAGATLAALAIPEVMGYAKIAGMPVITGLYTILVPMALFAVFGSSRHLVVGAVPRGLPHPGLPQVERTAGLVEKLTPTAFALFVVILAQSTATSAYMPEAVLVSVVFLIGVDLIDLGEMGSIYSQRRAEFWAAVVTTAR